jgi:hypothetical protein
MTYDPRTLEWQEGQLPPVEEVAYDCVIVLFSDKYVGLVFPHGDNLNPLRWTDHSQFPFWGIDRPQGFWAYLSKGSESKPSNVKTWKEYCEEK